MISSGQFVNGIWMGTILLMLGLVPGLFQKISESIANLPGKLVSPYLPCNRVKPSFRQPRWLAVPGMAIIMLTFVAYFAS